MGWGPPNEVHYHRDPEESGEAVDAPFPIDLHRKIVAENIQYAEKLMKQGTIEALSSAIILTETLALLYFLREFPQYLPLICLGSTGFALTNLLAIIHLISGVKIDTRHRTSIDTRLEYENRPNTAIKDYDNNGDC